MHDSVSFPDEGLVWDFNYRGDLVFLDQARAQQQAKSLQLEDGWVYFIHGWLRVIEEVFHIFNIIMLNFRDDIYGRDTRLRELL